MRLLLLVIGLAAGSAAIAQTSSPAQTPTPPNACAAPEHRQFDFWVGDWDVVATGSPEKHVGTSKIESLYNGCGIRENWQPNSKQTGGSLNNFDTAAKKWRQTWIDSSNSRVDFEGAFADGKMVLIGLWKGVNGPGKDALTRMTYSRVEGGAVRQFGENSADGGKTWIPSFDFTYLPRKAQ